MRREFIILLLGIICISTLSSLLSGYTQIEIDKLLLDTVVGAVGAGNFSYWQLGHTGPLLVELTSLTGDADLYVSDGSSRPSYEADRNNFSSATCGPDMVNIPPSFPRPIGIGVFGHWSHALSEYSIQVFLDTSAVLNEQNLVAMAKGEKIGEQETEKRTKERPASRKVDEEQKPRFMRLLNILDMIFEMFVI